MVKQNIQMIEGFIYEYPSSHKIIGIITEDDNTLSIHLKPSSELYNKFNN